MRSSCTRVTSSAPVRTRMRPPAVPKAASAQEWEQIAGRLNVPTDGFRSKDWSEFAAPGAPALDFVFTVCDNAANEVCPVWPGQPMTAHWGVPDPAAVDGSDETKRLAFARAYNQLYNRIQVFTALPVASLDKIALKKELDAIGQQRD